MRGTGLNNKYKRLIKNTFFFGIGSFGTKFINFFLVPFYTNYLTAGEYGLADIISTTATLLVLALPLDIMDGIIPYIADDYYDDNEVFSIGFKYVLGSSVLLLVALVIICELHLITIESYYFLFLFLIFVFNVIERLLTNYLQIKNNVLHISIANILHTLVTVCLNIYLIVYRKWGINGYLIAMTGGLFVSVIYQIIITLRKAPVKIRICKIDKRLEKKLLLFSFPLMLNGIFWWFNTSLDKYFIILICGATQNGIYTVATKLPTIITVVMTVFSQAWGLSAITEYDKNDKDGFFGNTYEALNALMVIMCSVIIISIIPLARLLFAKEFFAAWEPALCLVLSGVFSSLSSFVGSIFSAVKNSTSYMQSTIIAALVNIILNIILINSIGILGAAIATAISFFVVWLIRYLLVSKYINWKIKIRTHFFEYGLLIIQIALALLQSHCYPLQMMILILIFLLNYRYVLAISNKIVGRVRRK